MEFFLAILAVPFTTIPILLIFALRDWTKVHRSVNGPRHSTFGLVAMLSLLCEWCVPPAVWAAFAITGIGIAYSGPFALGLLLLWSLSVAVSTGASLLVLRGPPRAEAGTAGLILLLTSLLIIRWLTYPWDL